MLPLKDRYFFLVEDLYFDDFFVINDLVNIIKA